MSEIDPYEREAAKAAIKVLQRDLAEARKQRDKWAYECGENMKILKEAITTATRAIEQRDTLAEILSKALQSFECNQRPEWYPQDHWSNLANKALAAVKGGTP
jgi:hypothetical protein